MLKYALIALCCVIADQISKYIAETKLLLHQPLAIFPGLNFTLVYNKGAAFGMLHNAGGWQRLFFTVVGFVAIILILTMLKKLKKDQLQLGIGLSLVLGGAIGNLIDRLLYGQVVDFLDVYYKYWHFATFNIADIAISLGAFLMILDALGWILPGLPKPQKAINEIKNESNSS